MDALDLGARFRTITSTVPTIPFDSGNVRSVELPRSFLYRNIAVRLSGAANAGGAAAYAVNPEAPLGLIKKLELVADGRKILWTAAGRDLYRLCHIFRGAEGELTRPLVVAAAQNNNFSATIVIDNAAVRMQLPADSLFDPREYEKIELRVTWGTVTDIVTGGTAPSIAASTAIDVQVQQTTVGVEHIAFNRVIQFDEQAVAATSSNFTFNVPRSGLLSGILLRADHTGTNGATPTDQLVNFVTLKSDNSFNHVDRAAWPTLKARNVIEFQMLRQVPDSTVGLPVITQTNAVVVATGAPVTNNFPVGYAYIDLTEDGLMTSCLNTLALNVLQLILDVNVTGLTSPILRATYLLFEPIRPLVAS